MSDEHSRRFSSTYGHPVVETPQLDRLAERGTVYRNAYCTSPLCVPSRSSFMAGRLPHEIDRYNNSKVIEGRFPSYGGVLAEQGVHTCYIGSAANLYRDPYALGFSEMALVTSLRRPFEPEAVRSVAVGRSTQPLSGPAPGCFAEDIGFVDRSVAWLRDTAPGIAGPWTLTVNLLAPHPPYVADQEHWQRYAGRADLPEQDGEHVAAHHPYLQDLRGHGGWNYSDDLVRSLRQGYFGAVSHVDDQLGRVLDAIDEAGLADDTVVAYTTDHGELLGRFGVWGKCSLYEDAVGVPLVVAGPGFEAGRRVATPVSLLDLQAAIFAAVGADRPAGWHGEPLQAVPTDDDSRAVFASYQGHQVRGSAFMIRRGDWKLLYNVGAPHQLFNLADDPDELNDRSAGEPSILAELETELRAICDPETAHLDALAFQARQLAEIARVRRRIGMSKAIGLGWEEVADEEADGPTPGEFRSPR